jgi:hypothetical protein
MLSHFLVATMLNHSSLVTVLNHSSFATVSVIFHCSSAQPFLMLHCLVTQHCYNAQSFSTMNGAQPFLRATVLNHSSFCHSAYSFLIAAAREAAKSFYKMTKRIGSIGRRLSREGINSIRVTRRHAGLRGTEPCARELA